MLTLLVYNLYLSYLVVADLTLTPGSKCIFMYFFSCDNVLKEHDNSIQSRLRANKDKSEAVTTMESNLHQYFKEQNSKLLKVS